MAVPNFLCIGAQKAGTTWLHKMFSSHELVWIPPVRQLQFFNELYMQKTFSWTKDHRASHAASAKQGAIKVSDEESVKLCDLIAAEKIDHDWYESIFNFAPEAAVKGEMTPEYSLLDDKGVSQIAKKYPDLKIIFVVREPFERAVSGIKTRLFQQGFSKNSNQVDVDEFVTKCASNWDVVERGNYKRILDSWRRHFSEQQLLVLFSDELLDSPKESLFKVSEFLGVPYDGFTADPHCRINVSREFNISSSALDEVRKYQKNNQDYFLELKSEGTRSSKLEAIPSSLEKPDGSKEVVCFTQIEEMSNENLMDFFDLIRSDSLEGIISPVDGNLTYPRVSEVCSKTGVVIVTLSDKNGESIWYLFQNKTFVDGYSDGKSLTLVVKPMNDRENLEYFYSHHFEDYRKVPTAKDGFTFDRFMLSHSRPTHYFFDQLIYMWSATKDNFSLPIVANQRHFVDIKSLMAVSEKNDGTFLKIAPPSNSSPIRAGEMFRNFCTDLARSISPSDCFSSKFHDVIVWIGIMGGKRAWHEEVEFIELLATYFEENNKNACFIIDGHTGQEGHSLVVDTDVAIYEDIKRKVGSKVDLIPLLGQSYREKMYFSKGCDFFVCNGGSGCLTPLLLADLPGVAHFNRKLNAFHLKSNEKFTFVNDERVTDFEQSGNPTADNVSYSISPHVILKELKNLQLV